MFPFHTGRSTLRIHNVRPGTKGTIEQYWGEPVGEERARTLLSFILAQSMNDGMTKLGCGIKDGTGEAWLRYFGPVECAEPIWWEMVPPPPHVFPAMLKLIISIAELEDAVPIHGRIRAAIGRTPVDLELRLPDLYSFEIEWRFPSVPPPAESRMDKPLACLFQAR